MTQKHKNTDLLTTDLINTLKHLDNQVARQMQRSPQELAEKGLQKESLYQEKIETLCHIILTSIGNNECKIDSLIILSEALVKSFKLLMEELGSENLGRIRTTSCLYALEQIERDARSGKNAIKPEEAI